MRVHCFAPLYGTLCRSTPVFFLQDDHDHFDNDEATDETVTFPPDNFMLQSARATQRLWYPEFLPDPNRSPGLPGSDSPDQSFLRPSGLSESFGTLRYGRLVDIKYVGADSTGTVYMAGCGRWIYSIFINPQKQIEVSRLTEWMESTKT